MFFFIIFSKIHLRRVIFGCFVSKIFYSISALPIKYGLKKKNENFEQHFSLRLAACRRRIFLPKIALLWEKDNLRRLAACRRRFVFAKNLYYSPKLISLQVVFDKYAPYSGGDSELKYICAIDPSFSNSPTSDYFAMSVMELNQETNTSTLVHGYAVAGGDLKDHIQYFEYL